MQAPSTQPPRESLAQAVELTPELTERIARAWARAIGRTSYVPMTGGELHAFLATLAGRILAAVTATRLDLDEAVAVGAGLVDANFTDATALQRTLTVLGEQMSTVLPPARWGRRIAVAQGALAAGYAGRLRERTLAEQEQLQAAVVRVLAEQDQARTATLRARAEAEQARWASEARFRAVFSGVATGIAVSDRDGRIIEVNRALCEMFGGGRTEFRHRSVSDFIHAGASGTGRTDYAAVLRGERELLRLEQPYRRGDGSVMWTELALSLVRDADGAPDLVVLMVEDITDRYELQRSLHHRATHDPLTGLPNRTLFSQWLQAALGGAPDARVGLCYLDLDDFNAVNDTLGHDCGDYLLRAVANRLAEAAQATGAQVARMGGDEFVILVPDSTAERVAALAARVVAAVAAPVEVRGRSIRTTASVGVVECPVPGVTAADLMTRADTTLQWAKCGGRNRWVWFDAARHDRAVARYHLAAELPDALRRGDFFVEYQPLIRLADGRISGVEALVRWRHPDRGVIGPDQFIGLAEQTGHIVPLGGWVLTQACRQAVAWRRAYPDCPILVSVNLAERQVREDGVVRQVADILEQTGLAPAELQLELTESAALGPGGRQLTTLRSLARLGVRIAIDDFGTGYSNLAYLRNLPVHCLKLAGPFMAGLRSVDDPVAAVDQEIVATLTRLAHSLNLSVTAEGVETPIQAHRLREVGCDTAQGWHYAAAGPPGAVEPLFGVALR